MKRRISASWSSWWMTPPTVEGAANGGLTGRYSLANSGSQSRRASMVIACSLSPNVSKPNFS
jgi:hypothetical protein